MISDTGEFSFYLGASRLAPKPRPDEAAQKRRRPRQRVDTGLTLARDSGGFDPYNSTGRFDRDDAWSRLRKR